MLQSVALFTAFSRKKRFLSSIFFVCLFVSVFPPMVNVRFFFVCFCGLNVSLAKIYIEEITSADRESTTLPGRAIIQ